MTPVVAVLYELKELRPRAEIRFWCDRKFAPQAREVVASYDSSIKFQTVISGKFRRYSHLSKLQHLTIPSVVFPNLRDSLFVGLGVVQSLVRLILWRPDVVFAKGGYVCLPVGLAARILGIPLVIHDSDAHPGLTNRILAPFAKRIATGVPLEHYNYPAAKSTYVGVPISAKYRPLDTKKRTEVKKSLGFDPTRPLLVCVGGGLGSRQLNDAVALHLKDLLLMANVVLVSGAAQYDELVSLTPQNDPRFRLEAFISEGMPELLGAADIVVSRAGATFLLELAALGTPTVLVPGKQMVWQVKHAKVYADSDAVLVLDEDDFVKPDDRSLVNAVKMLLDNAPVREKLSRNLHRLARPHAARDMAEIIIRSARKD